MPTIRCTSLQRGKTSNRTSKGLMLPVAAGAGAVAVCPSSTGVREDRPWRPRLGLLLLLEPAGSLASEP